MMNENDFIILNCSGTLTNMTINGEMLEITRKHFQEQNKVMKSILRQLERLNERLENGTELQHSNRKNNE